MIKKKSKAAINTEETVKRLQPTQYQEAVIFKIGFQKSDECKDFRKAWIIPQKGFKNSSEYEKWHKSFIKKTNI